MKKTEVIAIDPLQPDSALIRRAAELLLAGRLVAFPTETVYGLGANALDAEAVRGIFAAKGRPAHNPLIVHISSTAAAQELVADWPEVAQRLAEKFWPGSLTLVLPRRAVIPDIVTAGGPTVALRVPAHPVALALIEAAGVPVAAPSANRSNRLSPTRAEHVLQDLDGRIDLILDGGPAWGGLESTVINLTVHPPRVLRPGLVTPAQIDSVVGFCVRPASLAAVSPTNGPQLSPGMLRKHYAPAAPLERVEGNGWERVQELAAQGLRIGWLSFIDSLEQDLPTVTKLQLPNTPGRCAEQLYALLRDLDAADVDCIVVEMPPDEETWLAVRDRLVRAAI